MLGGFLAACVTFLCDQSISVLMINRMLRQEDWDSLSITSRHYFTRERSNVIASVFFFQIDMRSFLIEHIELPIFHYDFFRYFLIILWFVLIIIIVNKSKWKRNTTFLKSFIKSVFSLFCCWFANKKSNFSCFIIPISHHTLTSVRIVTLIGISDLNDSWPCVHGFDENFSQCFPVVTGL